ncbi:Phage-related protein [Mycobacteroides abscessus subsp. abscessus]|uniref:hypothetical protein n=1 Tax=Mycobacteroides abscessus TaxID=36809 RepID=UPI00092CB938|nr:hypothetical protein [Mycobacteroides abscessus]SHS97897.1 Phage-related protein [Mycobacteroides abscessus subsp. abscessus]SLK65070.1 Phage-related protein [Mycobacteroides abscessus subsp. abscessus]
MAGKGPGGKEVGRISIRVVPDTTRFRDRLKKDLEALEKTLKGELGMTPDMDGFREKVKAATAGMEAKVKVDADTNPAKAALDRFQRRMSSDDGIKLKLDPKFDYALRQRLKKMGAIKVPVELTFRQKLSGFLKKGFSEDNKFGRLNRGILDIGDSAFKAVTGVRAFGMSLVSIVAIASLLVPAISIVSGALIALPGILTGLVAPIAAVALGLDGIKKAAENAGIPAAFKSLQATVSQVFAEGLTPVFTRLLDIMPALKTGFSAVAGGVVSMADGFVNAITSSRGMAQIEGTLFNIGDALTRAAPGIENFTSGMLTLVNSFSTKFPGMADAFNGFAERFLNWVEKITTIDASGTSQFDRAMQGLGETLKGLGGVVGDLILKGFEWLSNPENIDKIKAFFIEVKRAIDLLWPALDKVFSAVLRTMDALNNIGSFLSGDWASITPGTGLDSLVSGLDILKGTFSETFNAIKTIVSSTWDYIATAATGVWDSLGDKLTGLASNISGAFTNIGPDIVANFGSIVPSFTDIINQVVSVFAGGGTQLTTEAGSWPGRIVAALGDVGSLLANAGRALMDGLLSGIKAGFQAVTGFVGTIAGTIASLKGPLPYDRVVLTPNGEALMEGLGTGLQNGFQNVLAMAKEMAQQISRAMSDGTDLSGMLGGNKFPDLTKMLDTIEQERKSLKVQLDNTADKGMKSQLRDQMRQLQLVKDQLSLDKDKLKNAQKYGGELANQVGKQDDLGQKIWDAGVNLGKATKDQLMSDLNIGGGAVSNLGDELMNWGLNAGKKFIFNVNSMDDALAGQRNLVNREALQFDRR